MFTKAIIQGKESKANTYTEQKYKFNTFVFAPIFHEMNSKI